MNKYEKVREQRMADGKGDKWEGMQQSVMPEINEEMKGFKIEMLFEYPNPVEEGTYLDWAHGTVMDVIGLRRQRSLG